MAISLTSVRTLVRKSSIKVDTKEGEQTLEFSYKPHAYTPEMEKRTREERNSDLVGGVLIAVLLEVIDWIDLETEPGVPVKITAEGLSIIPLRILNSILENVNESMDPGKKKSGDSGGSFSG